MITLSYSEVKKVCEVETQNLVDKKKLKEHCEKHNLSYHGVLTFLRGDLRRKRNVKLMISFDSPQDCLSCTFTVLQRC